MALLGDGLPGHLWPRWPGWSLTSRHIVLVAQLLRVFVCQLELWTVVRQGVWHACRM